MAFNFKMKKKLQKLNIAIIQNILKIAKNLNTKYIKQSTFNMIFTEKETWEGKIFRSKMITYVTTLFSNSFEKQSFPKTHKILKDKHQV